MFSKSGSSARKVLRHLGAAAMATFALSSMTHAQVAVEMKPVTVQLDWVLAGPNSGLIVVKEKGFLAEEELDVTISQGKRSGSMAQIVGSKAVQFGFSDGYVIANSISNVYRRNPAAAIVLESSDEAVSIVKKHPEAASAEITRRERELSWNTRTMPTTAGRPLGWMAGEDWASMMDIMTAYGGMTAKLDPISIYASEYVPDGVEYLPSRS